MTNNILEEIIYCGISTDETILHFGAGYSNGDFLNSLMEVYEQDFEQWKEKKLYTGVDANKSKIKSLTKKYKPSDQNTFVETSLQDYLDLTSGEKFDWVVLTGVFDSNEYQQKQHHYVNEVVSESFEKSNIGVIFTLKENIDDDFSYNILSFFIGIVNSYNKFIAKRIDNNNFIFCITK